MEIEPTGRDYKVGMKNHTIYVRTKISNVQQGRTNSAGAERDQTVQSIEHLEQMSITALFVIAKM